jgi:hypothetical protein
MVVSSFVRSLGWSIIGTFFAIIVLLLTTATPLGEAIAACVIMTGVLFPANFVYNYVIDHYIEGV